MPRKRIAIPSDEWEDVTNRFICIKNYWGTIDICSVLADEIFRDKNSLYKLSGGKIMRRAE